MVFDLVRAVLATVVAALIPGWFWTRCLRPAADWAEQLAYSAGLSITLVPVAALLQMRLLGSGLSTAIAVFSVAVVFGAGVVAYLVSPRPSKGVDDPIAPFPSAPRTAEFALLIPALALVLGSWIALSGLLGPMPVWRLLVLLTALLLAASGVLYAFRAAPAGETKDQNAAMPRPGSFFSHWCCCRRSSEGMLDRSCTTGRTCGVWISTLTR